VDWTDKEKKLMPTLEERLQALEQEHAELKKAIELQTIAIGALVNKTTLEKLNEKYDKIFETLMAHDRFTNEQLAELRKQQIEEDGKIVGLQTEMRQRFNEQDSKIAGLQTTQSEHTTLLQQILARLPEK
jgi:endonuclease III